ncbi:MAG: cell division protein FtsA [Spirochaetes bacterium GWB1_36_13]|nr:MAG: cell division protein FtsA [Spirochaetes bacterium GWB1_36_13]
MSDIQVGIDIGSSKTVVVISQNDEFEDQLLVLGLGKAENTGVRKGKIINIEHTIHSIKKAAEQAVLMAGLDFNQVNVNIQGEISSINSQGIVGIARKDREVSSKDVQRVIDLATHNDIGHDKRIVHVFPQHFKLDEQDFIKDPIGMTGFRLEGKVHLITSPKINITNIKRCVERSGFVPKIALANAYASSNAVLTEDDRLSGVLLLDIGAGTTDMIVYQDGSPSLSFSFLVGGNNLTKDLSMGIKVAEGTAEKIKKRFGCVYSDLVDPYEEIEVPIYGKNHVQRITKIQINSYLEPRAEEILLMVKNKLNEKNINLEELTNGCIITGGVANLSGITELAEKVLGLHTRIGLPQKVSGVVDEEIKDPAYSTAIGLCLGEKNYLDESTGKNSGLLSQSSSGFKTKVKDFFKEILG